MARKKKSDADPNLSTSSPVDIEVLPIPAISKTAITKARDIALAIVTETQSAAAALVIENNDHYHTADEILHTIKVTQKRLDEPFEEVIRPVRTGLDRVYALRRSIENPLLDLETVVKEKMRAYKVEEYKRLELVRREQEAQQAEAERQERLRVMAEQAQLPAQWPTPPPPAPVEVYALPATPVPQPVRAASSSATPIKRWAITDMDLLIHAITLDMAPRELLTVSMEKMDALFKQSPETVATFPGVEIRDDFRISGR